MIRPSPKLVHGFGLTVLPLSAVGGLVPGAAPFCLGAIAALALAALVDLFLARRPLQCLTASLPGVVRLTRDREGLLPVVVQRSHGTDAQAIRLGLVLPEAIESRADTVAVYLPAGSAACRVDWACTPRLRGRVEVTGVCLESSSPLGLWAVMALRPATTELRCYPDLRPERRHLAGLFLHREGIGSHPRRQVGQGREFEKLRDYLPGDSFEDIHWRATAKRGRPITREYQVEKTQEIYVIVDASRLSARSVSAPAPAAGTGHDGPDILELYIRTALVLALVARRQSDLFGLATFTDRTLAFLRAGVGQTHYGACRDALYRLQAAPVSPDFDELCAFLRTRLRRRALLVFLTNLDDPQLAESFARNMTAIGRQHVVVAAMVQPPGAQPVFSAPVADDDGIVTALAGHLAWEDLRALTVTLRRRGVLFRALGGGSLCPEIVSQYAAIKQRQIL